MFGFTLTQDFEGDQFTFFKVPLEDLEALYGVRATELAIFDRVENHIEAQLERGRICLIEMDSFYMPDTHGVGYRKNMARPPSPSTGWTLQTGNSIIFIMQAFSTCRAKISTACSSITCQRASRPSCPTRNLRNSQTANLRRPISAKRPNGC